MSKKDNTLLLAGAIVAGAIFLPKLLSGKEEQGGGAPLSFLGGGGESTESGILGAVTDLISAFTGAINPADSAPVDWSKFLPDWSKFIPDWTKIIPIVPTPSEPGPAPSPSPGGGDKWSDIIRAAGDAGADLLLGLGKGALYTTGAVLGARFGMPVAVATGKAVAPIVSGALKTVGGWGLSGLSALGAPVSTLPFLGTGALALITGGGAYYGGKTFLEKTEPGQKVLKTTFGWTDAFADFMYKPVRETSSFAKSKGIVEVSGYAKQVLARSGQTPSSLRQMRQSGATAREILAQVSAPQARGTKLGMTAARLATYTGG